MFYLVWRRAPASSAAPQTRKSQIRRAAWRSLTAEAARLAGEATERAGEDRASAEKPFRKIRFHDLRHTAVTLMASAGVSAATIMSISGHLSKRMVEPYTHIGLAAKKEAGGPSPFEDLRPGGEARTRVRLSAPMSLRHKTRTIRAAGLSRLASSAGFSWWARRGSNPGPPACEAGALTN